MIFTERLHRILQAVEGARAVCLIGRDGIAIERLAVSEEPNLDVATAQFTDIAKKLQAANSELEAGEIREMIERTDRYLVILSAVTPEYFLLMILSQDGSLGRARYELRKAVAVFHDELA